METLRKDESGRHKRADDQAATTLMGAEELQQTIAYLEETLRVVKAKAELLTNDPDRQQVAELAESIDRYKKDPRWVDAQRRGPVLAEKVRGLITPRETENARDLPVPSEAHYSNAQIGLFQAFVANTDRQRDKLSNAVELWDSMPRYSMSRQEMSKLRVQDEFLRPHKVRFQHRGGSYTCVITPAYTTDFDGKGRYFYPSASEELVEEALRKLAVEKGGGYYDEGNRRSGVAFSLYELRAEMGRQGHTRSYQEIVQSLNILSHCVVDLVPDGEGEKHITSACLPLLAAVSAKQLETDPDSRWVVQFHPLVTASIDQAAPRQYNYELTMSLTTQLARWLHKQLVIKYTFADAAKPFEIRFSTVKRDSGLLQGYARSRDEVRKLDEAFAELKGKKVIDGYIRKDETGPRKKLLDVVFTVRASGEFIAETKAANRRSQDAKLALRSGLAVAE